MNYKLLHELIANQKISLNQMSNELEISRTGLVQMLERQTLTVTTLEKIAILLKVDPRIFFKVDEYEVKVEPLPEVAEWKTKYYELLEENRDLRKDSE